MINNILGDTMFIDYSIRIFVALLVGALIGVERLRAHKIAGMRTYSLVCMGSAIFTIIGEMVYQSYPTATNPTFIIGQIITGIGFLLAGMIVVNKNEVVGLTTASGLWVTAGVGCMLGLGIFKLAITAMLFVLFAFTVLYLFEKKVFYDVD